jgi:ADP-ribosylglycohydrolase
MPIQIKDRFIGCLEGLAIGDALGFPVEFKDLWEIKQVFGSQGVTGFDSIEKCLGKKFPYPVGSYSDDTQMALATARGLLNSKSTELDDIMPSRNTLNGRIVLKMIGHRVPHARLGLKISKRGFIGRNLGSLVERDVGQP